MRKIKQILSKIYHRLPHFIKSDILCSYNRAYNHYLKLKRKYSKYINVNIKCENKVSNYIFTCWLQGEENAPKLVQECFRTMRECMPERKLVIITSDNLKDYVDLPDYIVSKWRKGIITHTHFSDIIRTALLVRHGGLWLDSTVLCTGSIDRYIDKSTDLFVYKNEHRGNDSCALSSWLIYAKPNNPILVNTLNILYIYWKNHNHIIDYFMYHKIFTLVTAKFKDEWEKIPFYSNIEPHILWFHYFYDNFNSEVFERLKEMSNFHKLSNKFDVKKLGENNFYDYLINQNKAK